MERGTGKISAKELEELFTGNGFTKEQQVITQMQFPFAQKAEYIEIYNGIARTNRMLYDIAVKDDTVWIGHIDVGNTVFVRQ